MAVTLSDKKAFDNLVTQYEIQLDENGELKLLSPLYSKKFDAVSNVIVSDGRLTIYTSLGELTIRDYHSQDCCENVYADWSYLKPFVCQDFKTVMTNVQLDIVPVDSAGFVVRLKSGRKKAIKWFVPCYNEQNGYYSSDLSLIVSLSGIELELDISDTVIDDIN